MRSVLPWWVALAVALAAPSARSEPEGSDRKLLTAAEVQKYFVPYGPSVRSCYLTHATNREATGTLRIELIIHRDGSVFRFGVTAPGVKKPWLTRLGGCLRKLSTTWHFPVRGGFTNVVVPFIYVKSNAPGTGPFESCWSASGCPSKTAEKKR